VTQPPEGPGYYDYPSGEYPSGAQPGGYPPYPPYPGYPGYPPYPPRKTNAMAIASLVSAFVVAPLGVVFGHISLSQIKRTGEDGRGLAIAGLIVGYLATALAILVVISTIALVIIARDLERSRTPRDYPGLSAEPMPGQPLPPFNPPKALGNNCQYPAIPEPASKPVTPPRSGTVPRDPEQVSASISTNRGNIGLQLDNAMTPCTVNNFASLAQQGFFDDTPCHRLTTGDLSVLQCGDPTGTGSGGPGYRFPNEYPTNQYRLTDPAVQIPVVYPRGTLAMANSGVGTNGSQFFLVYEDSALPPTYTVFGTIDDTGLATLDDIAAAGIKDGGTDGEPAESVRITSARLD
jgi:peptidyl-prolyl cis-trans isomerase B (cyclophilin B)